MAGAIKIGKKVIFLKMLLNLAKQANQLMSTRRTKQSKKQQRVAGKDNTANRKFFMILIGITIILLLVMYFVYTGF